MSLSRKHFRMIAEVINETPIPADKKLTLARVMASGIAQEGGNSNFSRSKFIDACMNGITVEEDSESAFPEGTPYWELYGAYEWWSAYEYRREQGRSTYGDGVGRFRTRKAAVEVVNALNSAYARGWKDRGAHG